MKLTRLVPVFAVAAWIAACGGSADVTDNGNDLGNETGGAAGAGPDGTGSFAAGIGGSILGNDTGGSGSSCKPKTCKELKKDCGPVADGCGDVVDCGGCGAGEVCGIEKANTCTVLADLCQPVTKEVACEGKQCGIEGDGCGDTYDCGECAQGAQCGYEQPFQCAVVPVGDPDQCPAKIPSCAEAGAECGKIGNGCGGEIDCDVETGGGCTNGTFCGLGGPGQCGDTLDVCVPLDPAVACAGKCGLVSNGCGEEVDGGLIDCTALFPCPSGQACGASGTPNVCGSAVNACQPLDQAAACGNRTCGMVSDGCEGSYSCGSNNGTCGANGLCQAGSCQTVCTPVSEAIACQNKECGVVSNGCNGTYDCGDCASGETCGLLTAFQCDATPPQTCQKLTKAQACGTKECGIVYDGCGTAASNQIQCGDDAGGCPSGQYCGIDAPFMCDALPTPTCGSSQDSCADLGWACGIAVNDCGQTFDCATENRSCTAVQSCQGGITGPTQCVSDPNAGNCPLCDKVPNCNGRPQVTKITGRVITPGLATDTTEDNRVGVPNAFVYILRTNDPLDLPTIGSGVPVNGESCDRCEEQDLGAVLTSAVTNAEGYYELSGNIPVDQQFVLVVKVGKFRRAVQMTIPKEDECETTPLPTTMAAGNPTRLPRDRNDGLAVNIPRIAVSTGQIDAMECVFYKMGISGGEFTRPQQDGRVHLYRSNGGWPDAASQACNAASNQTQIRNDCPSCSGCSGNSNCNTCRTNFLNGITDSASLFDTQAHISAYDMVVFDCEQNGYGDEGATADTNVRQYVNRGGRMFASHLSYTWISNTGGQNYSSANRFNARLNTAADWSGTLDTSTASGTGLISFNPPRTRASSRADSFSQWMVSAGVIATPTSSFNLVQPRSLVTGLNDGSEEFVYVQNGRTQQFSFNTPLGAPPELACGRVAYSGFHVAATSGNLNLSGSTFPSYCTNAAANNGRLTPQEKVLLYALFDLGACVGDEPDPPGCTKVACPANTCGIQPDGCGDTQDCGGCGGGQVCSNSQCVTPGCTATTCAIEGATCGIISNGCGGTLDCGDCPICTPIPEATACAGKCGYVSDGCSGVYQCPDCSGGLSCMAGACTAVTCNPSACPGELECGYVSDGCSGATLCGTCASPEVCGAGGVDNTCGVPTCTKLTCEDLGANCGLIGDGCGGVVDCGTCDDDEACGIRGMANQCSGCEPLTCDDVGAECGAIGNGCGQIVQCGACPAGQICGAEAPNKCGGGTCTARTCQDAGAECGKIGDGCGGTLDCGKCPSGQLCGIDTPYQCGDVPDCVPTTCKAQGAQCGKIGDGCGKALDCGECPSGAVCGKLQPNKCAMEDIK